MLAMQGPVARITGLIVAGCILVSCAATPRDPSGPASPSATRAQPPGTPGAAAGLRAADVPQIPDAPAPDSADDSSSGALALLVESDAGRVVHGVAARCRWADADGEPGVVSVVGEPVDVYGERVRPAVHDGQPVLEREWAPYVAAGGSTLDGPRTEGDLTFVRATRVRASTLTPAPGGVSIEAWRRPLGGESGALIVRTLEVAWRCAPPPPERTPPPEPAPHPTPVCPPPVVVDAPPFPRTTLSAAGQSAVGEPASVTLVACTRTGTDSSPWIVPDTGVVVAEGTPLLFRVEAPGVELFRVDVVQAGPAEVGAGPGLELEVRGDPRAGGVVLEAPPPGDWSVAVSVVLNDRVHGAVWSAPVYFRVRVAG